MYVIVTPAFSRFTMTGGEKVTSYEIIIPAFTRFTMTKKEKIIHQAKHTIHQPLRISFLSLGVSPPLVYVRNATFFVITSLLFPSVIMRSLYYFVIARSAATKQSHPILLTVFFTLRYTYYAGNSECDCHSLLTQ